jgi:hypothetical protein
MAPLVDLFEHDFECSPIEEISAGLPLWYFPGGSTVGGKDGVLVNIVSVTAGEWVGIFAFGDLSPNGVTGVYTCPDRGRLCVVSLGQGVYVAADEPPDNELVPLDPVMGVFPVPAANLLVMHDFVRFVAYDKDGICWKTPSLSWDGIRTVQVGESVLSGKGWDAPKGEEVEFEIELATGVFSGGSSPELLAS